MTTDGPDPTPDLRAGMQALLEAISRAAALWLEQHRPLFEAIAKLADDPVVRAYLASVERGEVERQRPCYCLCGAVHRDQPGICTGEGVTIITRRLLEHGLVDVAVCGPCAEVTRLRM